MSTMTHMATPLPAARHSWSWGLPVLMAVLLLGLLSVWLGQNPAHQNLSNTLAAPGPAHWLGTDHLGRDLMARLGEAIRVSLWLALGSAFLAVTLGTLLGLCAAVLWGLTTLTLRATVLSKLSAEKTLFYQIAVTAAVAPSVPRNLLFTASMSAHLLAQCSTKSGLPISLSMILVIFVFFYFLLGKERKGEDQQIEIKPEPWNKDQLLILSIFGVVVILWSFREYFNLMGFNYRDEVPAILGAEKANNDLLLSILLGRVKRIMNPVHRLRLV